MDSTVEGEEVSVDETLHLMRSHPGCDRCHFDNTIERDIRTIASTAAAVARSVGLWEHAQALIEDVHGPNCGLCGERCTRSHRTDRNVHADCWRREKE